LLITAQSILDQRDGQLPDATLALVTDAAGGHPVSSRWRSMVSSGTAARLVIGVTPGDWFSRGLYQPTGESETVWQKLRDGQIGLSEIAASRLGVAEGATVELPTVAGSKRYRVAGIIAPRMIDDTAVGDIVVASEAVARSDWAAARDQIAVRYPNAAEATAHRADFLALGAGLSVYDNQQWRSAATGGLTRYLEPLTVSAYVVMAAAGLSVLNVFVLGLVQRKRERAVLRAIGTRPGQEQAVVVAHAGVLGLMVALLGGVGGVGLTYLWSLGSPVFYGITIDGGVVGLPLRTGVAAVTVLVLAAAVYPAIHARRLETAEVLRTG
jgi:putative ABC transport system permease protein